MRDFYLAAYTYVQKSKLIWTRVSLEKVSRQFHLGPNRDMEAGGNCKGKVKKIKYSREKNR